MPGTASVSGARLRVLLRLAVSMRHLRSQRKGAAPDGVTMTTHPSEPRKPLVPRSMAKRSRIGSLNYLAKLVTSTELVLGSPVNKEIWAFSGLETVSGLVSENPTGKPHLRASTRHGVAPPRRSPAAGHVVEVTDTSTQEPLPIYTLLTTEQVAEATGISARTLEKWRLRRGVGIPFVKMPNGAVRYRPSAIEQWLLERESA